MRSARLSPLHRPRSMEEPAWRGTPVLFGFAPLRTAGRTTIRGFASDLDTSLGEN